jgi:hypothetical protein
MEIRYGMNLYKVKDFNLKDENADINIIFSLTATTRRRKEFLVKPRAFAPWRLRYNLC